MRAAIEAHFLRKLNGQFVQNGSFPLQMWVASWTVTLESGTRRDVDGSADLFWSLRIRAAMFRRVMKRVFSLIVLSMLNTALSLAAVEAREAFPLWPGAAPGALGSSANDIPTLTPYVPAAGSASGASIVICPGGGYGGLAGHEGADYALYLAEQGVTCFVLKYRLGSHGYRHPAMMNDVNRAVRLVRHRAADFGVDARRVGVMGSSAGGHLASTAVTHWDEGHSDAADPVERWSSRPDFGILCYAVISLGEFTHQGSKKNLLGEKPDPALVWLLSNELQVTPRTPPCFLWHTAEDTAVPVENSLLFAAALQRAKVPFDLHVFESGRHGIGLVSKPPQFENVHPWAKDLVFWLKQHQWAK